MIANISPCESNFEDTANTLKYANRTKDLKTTLFQNQSTLDKNPLEDQISKLKKELDK